MTAQEAIKWIKAISAVQKESIHKNSLLQRKEALHVAIEALENQIPKRPITYPGTNRADCPQCGNTVRGIKEPFGNYCSKCGQKLDWGENNA